MNAPPQPQPEGHLTAKMVDQPEGVARMPVGEENVANAATVAVPPPELAVQTATTAAAAAAANNNNHNNNHHSPWGKVPQVHYRLIDDAAFLLSGGMAHRGVVRPPLKRPIPAGRSSQTNPLTYKDANGVEKTFTSSLGLMTRQFMDMVMNSPDGTMDMNVAAVRMGTPKRRLYDICAVLVGVGVLEKVSKRTVRYVRGDGQAWKGALAEEKQLDRWLGHLRAHQACQETLSVSDLGRALRVVGAPTNDKDACWLVVQAPFGSWVSQRQSSSLSSSLSSSPGEEDEKASRHHHHDYYYYYLSVGKRRPVKDGWTLTQGRVFRQAQTDGRSISVHTLPDMRTLGHAVPLVNAAGRVAVPPPQERPRWTKPYKPPKPRVYKPCLSGGQKERHTNANFSRMCPNKNRFHQ